MTVPPFDQAATYVIQGVGPYAITYPYVSGAIVARIVGDGGELIDLDADEVTIAPASSSTTGDLYLSAALASAYAGRTMWVDRETEAIQGWEARYGDREVGMERQLDREVMAIQELRRQMSTTLRGTTAMAAYQPEAGRIPVVTDDGLGWRNGPSADDVDDAIAGVASLNVDLAVERAARIAGDVAVTGLVAAERIARIAGDYNLQTQISAIAGGSAITTENSFATRDAFVAWDAAASGKIAGMVMFAAGLSYVYDGLSTAIPDLPGWTPGRYVHIDHFGQIIPGDAASAAGNAAVIHRAWAYMAAHSGRLFYGHGEIYVSDFDGDGHALLLTHNNVTHVGANTILRNTDPYTNLLRIGPATMTGQGNGRMHTSGNTFEGITFDQGLKVQHITNPGGEDGTADGWIGVNGGQIASFVDNLGRRLRVTMTEGETQGAAFSMPTVPGQSYYVSIQLMQAAPAHTYICASNTVALSGAITALTQLATISDPLLRHSFEFTATAETTYLLLRQNSGGVTGTLDFKHCYCWPQYEEAKFAAVAVSCSGMQRTTFRRCVFRNSGHYLVACQNGGYVANTFDDCEFRDNMMDALDCKNNGAIQRGNMVSNCRFFRNSLKSNIGGGESASLDLSEGWETSNVYFETPGCNGGYGGALRFKTGEIGDASGRGEGGRRNVASNVRVEVVGVPRVGSFGFMAQNRLNAVGNLVVRGAYLGADIRGQGTQLHGAIITDVVRGVHFLNKGAGSSSPADVGRDSSLHGAMIRAIDRGIISQVTNVSLHGVSVESQNIGLELLAGTLTWQGGKLDAPVPLAGGGSILEITGVYGFYNYTRQHIASHSVENTGVFDIVIPHSLPFEPTVGQLVVGVRNTDAICQAAIYSLSAEAYTVRLRVFSAGTGSATVYVQYVNQRMQIA